MIDYWDYAPDPPERPEGPDCEECEGTGLDRHLREVLVRQGYTHEHAHRQSMCEACGGIGVEPEDRR